jgi:phosphoserine aminotransferase
MTTKMTAKPVTKPVNPCFSSGPCAKRPGWSLAGLEDAFLGRSHRATEGKARLKDIIERHRTLLGIPADYKIAIVPASDTGAIEMAMWSMLGERGVDVLAWEAFGEEWLNDVTKQLKLPDVRTFAVGYGELPDLGQVDSDRDVIFTWNGTTGGVRVPNADWIKPDRKGLTFCDATSAVFAYDMPWDKLDITTWSWQKVLGGEAAHGMLVLSPRAVERLLTYKPERPLPKLFRMTAGGKLIEGVFAGETINTPSMLAVEDCLDALKWVEGLGGLPALRVRVQANFDTVNAWVAKTDWVDFLCDTESARSKTSVCLKITDPWFIAKDDAARQDFIKAMTGKIDKEGAGYDLAGHMKAPAGLRIWCGATVEASDIAAVLPWLDWAFSTTKAERAEQAA